MHSGPVDLGLEGLGFAPAVLFFFHLVDLGKYLVVTGVVDDDDTLGIKGGKVELLAAAGQCRRIF